ncbi:spore germination protein GerKA [Halalkalibacter wakoensis JCM 9140]|uniref:Spore germination protein GerKA n=1 Tax=Halalkalibacter wakoensis JCM 9140 TaxID=1236970 RepID=W4Q0U3_9BACI|nr:spore germination protein GerKA [Halalkalibacter wakoensis JCM 9140]
MNSHEESSIVIAKDLDANHTYIQKAFHFSEDVKKREFLFHNRKGICLFLETLIDDEKLDKLFLGNLHFDAGEIKAYIDASEIIEVQDLAKLPSEMHQGKVAVFLEGEQQAYVFDVRKEMERSIGEPENEKIVRGSHDGFVEGLQTNLYLIRKRVNNPNLVIKYHTLGTETKTKLAIVYLNHIAKPDIVKSVEDKIQSISSDMIFSPGYIEEYLEDDTFSPFPQMLNTERPDRVMANLLDGRIAIFSDGDPTALICPISFFSFYQSPDDYNSRFFVGSFYRILRMVSFLIAIFVPAIYIATISFHFEVIPADLVLPVKSSVERIPYPPIIEAILMELTIELIREAGIRLPIQLDKRSVLLVVWLLEMLLFRQGSCLIL